MTSMVAAVLLAGISLLLFWALLIRGAPKQESVVSAPLDRQGTVEFGGDEGVHRITVEVAQTGQERRQGLAGRSSLAQDTGMLFVWEREWMPTFTMAGMHFPLDIIFINSNGEVVDIAQNLPECPTRRNCVTVRPKASAQYVLELNAGAAERYSISEGIRLKLEITR